MDEGLAALVEERFGRVVEWEREARRLPPPREVARRRRVLALAMEHERTTHTRERKGEWVPGT